MSDVNPDLKALASRLSEAVKSAGGKAVVSREAPVPLSSLDRYMKAMSEPPAVTLGRIAKACRTDIDFLIYGEGRPTVMIQSKQIAPIAPDIISGSADAEDDFVRIPRFDVQASAGPGRAVVTEIEVRSEIAFRSAWLRSLGVAPEHAQFLEADGDSMLETIRDGDLLLINRQIDRVVNDAIYVVVLAGHVMVKRLQLLFDGSIMLISDNPRYQPERVDRAEVERLQVEGRVRWYGRAI